MPGSPGEVVIAFVVGQLKVIKVRLSGLAHPVMVTQGWEKAILLSTLAVTAAVGMDILMVKLPNAVINGLTRAIRIIVVAGGENEIGLPGFNQLCHLVGILIP